MCELATAESSRCLECCHCLQLHALQLLRQCYASQSACDSRVIMCTVHNSHSCAWRCSCQYSHERILAAAATAAAAAAATAACWPAAPAITVYLDDGDREPDFVIKVQANLFHRELQTPACNTHCVPGRDNPSLCGTAHGLCQRGLMLWLGLHVYLSCCMQ
jgi:hypothetical protein